MRINIHHDEALVKHEIFSNRNKSWLATHSPLSTDNWQSGYKVQVYVTCL